MHLDPWTLLAILGMAAGSFGCRAGGYWLFNRFNPSPAVRTVLSYVPGTLFVSYVVPSVAHGGPKEWIGAAVALVRRALVPPHRPLAALADALRAIPP